MTETKWLSSDAVPAMIAFLAGLVARKRTKAIRRTMSRTTVDRKLRLYFCARCRGSWADLVDERSRVAVEVAERFADGCVGKVALKEAEQAAAVASRATGTDPALLAYWATCPDALRLARHEQSDDERLLMEAAAHAGRNPQPRVGATQILALCTTINQERAVQASLLRDLFGNPFRPSPAVSPAVLAWNEHLIPRLAQAIYDDRHLPEGTFDNGHLAMLSDALLDAGCDDEGILNHLRQPDAQHVRGCWVVDLLLGNS